MYWIRAISKLVHAFFMFTFNTVMQSRIGLCLHAVRSVVLTRVLYGHYVKGSLRDALETCMSENNSFTTLRKADYNHLSDLHGFFGEF